MKQGLDAIFSRINNYLDGNLVNIVTETIQESGIKKRSGNLISSIKYLGQTRPGYFEAMVGADYASYLNEGYDPFDMKPGLMGKTVPIDTPEGTIFRRVGPNSTGWIHPGYEGKFYIQKAQKKLYEGILTVVNNLSELTPGEM